MGQRIKEFDFRTEPMTRTNPYPLDEWMDGSIWELVRGEDFEDAPKRMQARLHYYAFARGYVVKTKCVYSEDRETVVFRYTPKVPPP